VFVCTSANACSPPSIACRPTQVDATITHRDPWILGNREDGYLVGLENLIEMLQ
jgi:hypothetical protein